MILAGKGEGLKGEEFEAFEVEPFVKRLLKDLPGGYVDKTRKYTYTLRKMYDFHRTQLGLDKTGLFLPSVRAASDPQLNLEKMRRYVTMMDSMTDEELDKPEAVKQISKKRVMEIANASNAGVSEVMEMIKTYKRKAKGWQDFYSNATPSKNWRVSDV